jgi:hypothetical protein
MSSAEQRASVKAEALAVAIICLDDEPAEGNDRPCPHQNHWQLREKMSNWNQIKAAAALRAELANAGRHNSKQTSLHGLKTIGEVMPTASDQAFCSEKLGNLLKSNQIAPKFKPCVL